MRTTELDHKLDEIGISNRQSISEAADKIMAALESLDLSDGASITAVATQGRVYVVVMSSDKFDEVKVVQAELLDGEWKVSTFNDYTDFMLHNAVRNGGLPEEWLQRDGETIDECLKRRDAWIEQSMREDECK